jgi:hypothetical protein
MADFKASQRVRLWNGTNDFGFTNANGVFVRLSDGTNNLIIDGSGNAQVTLTTPIPAGTNNIGDVDVLSVVPGVAATNLGKAIDSAAGATDTGVAALVVRDDALTTLTPADGDYVPLRTDSTGALWVTLTAGGNSNIVADDSAFTVGTGFIGVNGYLADETAPDSVDEGDVGAARMTLDRKQLFVLVDATTDSQRLAIGSTGAASVNMTQINGTAISVANPLPVYISSTLLTTEVISYATSSALAADGSVNLDYTVTSTKTAKVRYIRGSASGAFKMTVQSGPVAGLVTKDVAFAGAAVPLVNLPYDGLLEVPDASTGTIRVTMRNDDNQAMDVYRTIVMEEI